MLRGSVSINTFVFRQLADSVVKKLHLLYGTFLEQPESATVADKEERVWCWQVSEHNFLRCNKYFRKIVCK